MRQINHELVARKARELIADEGFKQLLSVLKEGSLRDIALSASGEAERREELYRDLQAVGRIEMLIQALVDSQMLDARKEERVEGAMKRNGTKRQ